MMQPMQHCVICGEPPAVKSDLVPVDEGVVHRGVCHQHHTLMSNVGVREKLFALLELWDLRAEPLARLTLTDGPLVGVLVNHRPGSDIWTMEDQGGAPHLFTTRDVTAVEIMDAVARAG